MARIAGLTLVLLIVVASPASAGVVMRAGDGSKVVFEDRAGAVDRVEASAPDSWLITRLDGGADITAEGAGCSATGNGNSGTCEPAGYWEVLLGGSDDLFVHSALAVSVRISGGDGQDTVSFASSSAAVQVTIDDVANDGAQGDADSDVRADVENVTGGSGADKLTGDGDANVLDGGGAGDEMDGGTGTDTLRGGAGNDTIMARDGQADIVECGPDGDTVIADASDQVSDCEAVSYPDEDGDGVDARTDCDDRNAARRPGASDVPGNGIDEDCSGADTPAPAPGGGGSAIPAITSPIASRWRVAAVTRVLVLAVSGVPSGARVTVLCKGGKRKGCAFASKAVRTRGGKANLRSLFKRRLAAGAVIEIRITKRGHIGKVVRYRIRRGLLPSVTRLCLPPGAKSPQPCR